MTTTVYLRLPDGQEWPGDIERNAQFASVVETTDGIQLPPFCRFVVGGDLARSSSSVLGIRTDGVMIEDGIKAALAIADARGLGPVEQVDATSASWASDRKRRPGRPLGSGVGPERTRRIEIRLSESEYAALLARVERSGQSASEIVRAALIGEVG